MTATADELLSQYYVLEAQINSGEARAAGKLTATKAAARKLAAEYKKAISTGDLK